MLKKKIFTSTPLPHKPQTDSYMAAAKHVGTKLMSAKAVRFEKIQSQEAT
jgi:hypothetical protein